MDTVAFRVAAGSIPGRDHLERHGLLIGKNNQDAYSFWRGPNGLIVGVVCDGCGSKSNSEFGAQFAARRLVALFAEVVTRRLNASPTPLLPHEVEGICERVRQDFLAEMRVLARSMMTADGSFSSIIDEYFLFATIGFVVTPLNTFIFSVGDGVFAVNGEVRSMGPFAGNKPPYLGYGLVESEFSATPELLRFQVAAQLPTASLSSLLIGSDGLEHFCNAAERLLPGKTEPLGALNQFWEERKFTANTVNIRRRLVLANSQCCRVVDRGDKWDLDVVPGLLPDDTTLVVVVREENQEGGTGDA